MRRVVWVCGIGGTLVSLWAPVLGAQAIPKSGPVTTKANGQQATKSNTATPNPATDPLLQSKVDPLLDAWETQSATIRSLDAQFLREDVSATLGEITFYEGRAFLQGPNLACLDTHKLDVDRKTFNDLLRARKAGGANPKNETNLQVKKAFYDRVICTGTAIYHYDGSVKQIFEYPLAETEQTAALQQGPLTFLFDMKKGDLIKRYHFSLVEEKENAFVIQVVPREAIDRNAFEQAIVFLNKKTYLPDLLMLVEPNKNQQRFYLYRIGTNLQIPPGNFQHQGDKWKGWTLVKNPPLAEGERPGDNGAARDPAPRGATKNASVPPSRTNRR